MNYRAATTQALYTATEACAPDKRVSPTMERLHNLHGLQCDTNGLISKLSDLMADALSPDFPKPEAGCDGRVGPSLSALCDEVSRRCNAAEEINDRLRNLIDRLTV